LEAPSLPAQRSTFARVLLFDILVVIESLYDVYALVGKSAQALERFTGAGPRLKCPARN